MLLIASSAKLLRHIIERLQADFAMKDLGPLHYFLSIQVTCTDDGFFLSQQAYAEDLLERANLLQSKPAATPVDTKPKLSADLGDPIDASEYRSLAGALQYLTMTRPDLQYAVQQACLRMHQPKDTHLSLIKRILRYVHGTTHLGLQLRFGSTSSILRCGLGGMPRH
jgi:hypothetical protein